MNTFDSVWMCVNTCIINSLLVSAVSLSAVSLSQGQLQFKTLNGKFWK